MYDPLLITVKHFLSLHATTERPLVVACSGGPDSKALLYLLREAQKFFKLPLHVAHIDHGWREESQQEAQALRIEVERLGLPFHLRKLDGVPIQEEAARRARYDHLIDIAHSLGAQAIVLGHQMEDQAETVLKRILEGASLTACGGMKAVSMQSSVPLWRPLLSISKKQLIDWLQKQSISYVSDPTNLDSRYLRGKCRTTIIPELEAWFGKSIMQNLCLLGQRAQRLERYLQRAASDVGIQKLEELEEESEVVIEFLIRQVGTERGVILSREQIAFIMKKIGKGDPTKRLKEHIEDNIGTQEV